MVVIVVVAVVVAGIDVNQNVVAEVTVAAIVNIVAVASLQVYQVLLRPMTNIVVDVAVILVENHVVTNITVESRRVNRAIIMFGVFTDVVLEVVPKVHYQIVPKRQHPRLNKPENVVVPKVSPLPHEPAKRQRCLLLSGK